MKGDGKNFAGVKNDYVSDSFVGFVDDDAGESNNVLEKNEFKNEEEK